MDPEVRLLHDIYAAALAASPWQGVVGQAADLLQATSAFLFTPFQPPAAGGFTVGSGAASGLTGQGGG